MKDRGIAKWLIVKTSSRGNLIFLVGITDAVAHFSADIEDAQRFMDRKTAVALVRRFPCWFQFARVRHINNVWSSKYAP
jgi:hypothetical protein